MYCSAQYFAIPYGDSGSGSTSSRDGIGASRPYSAPPEEANSTRAPTCRAASSTLTVPTTFTCASSAGESTDARTSICAARWHTSSAPDPSITAARAPGSVTLTFCSCTRGSSRPSRPDDRSSATTTSSPLATSASATCEPMNPAPPVTRTRMTTNPHPRLIRAPTARPAEQITVRPSTSPCRLPDEQAVQRYRARGDGSQAIRPEVEKGEHGPGTRGELRRPAGRARPGPVADQAGARLRQAGLVRAPGQLDPAAARAEPGVPGRPGQRRAGEHGQIWRRITDGQGTAGAAQQAGQG